MVVVIFTVEIVRNYQNSISSSLYICIYLNGVLGFASLLSGKQKVEHQLPHTYRDFMHFITISPANFPFSGLRLDFFLFGKLQVSYPVTLPSHLSHICVQLFSEQDICTVSTRMCNTSHEICPYFCCVCFAFVKLLVISCVNTSRPGQDGRHFGRRHLQMRFRQWKCFNFDIIFT